MCGRAVAPHLTSSHLISSHSPHSPITAIQSEYHFYTLNLQYIHSFNNKEGKPREEATNKPEMTKLAQYSRQWTHSAGLSLTLFYSLPLLKSTLNEYMA